MCPAGRESKACQGDGKFRVNGKVSSRRILGAIVPPSLALSSTRVSPQLYIFRGQTACWPMLSHRVSSPTYFLAVEIDCAVNHHNAKHLCLSLSTTINEVCPPLAKVYFHRNRTRELPNKGPATPCSPFRDHPRTASRQA
jgi:hypothetical protein